MATLHFEPAFDIRLDFALREKIGPLPGGGYVGLVTIASGTISGPRMQGKVVPHSGGDWATIRADGIVEINAQYVLETSDGTLIHMRNCGYVVPKSATAAPEDSTPTYFRLCPTFRTPAGPFDWLMRTVIVGSGERRTHPDHSLFNYFAVL